MLLKFALLFTKIENKVMFLTKARLYNFKLPKLELYFKL